MFEGDVVLCRKNKEEVETKLESWRNAMEREEMEVSRSKTV